MSVTNLDDHRAKLEAVYFMQAEEGGPIKIGRCGSPPSVASRLKSIQTGHPYPLRVTRIIEVQDSLRLESELHHKFGAYRLCGEWFLPTIEVTTAAHAKDWAGSDPGRATAKQLKAAFERGVKVGSTHGSEKSYDDIIFDLEQLLADFKTRHEFTVEYRDHLEGAA